MIQQVFLDTNILIDFIFKCEPFDEGASRIIELAAAHENIHLSTSALSLVNVAYMARKVKKNAHATVQQLIQGFTVVALTDEILKEAAISNFADFEDAVQYFSALSFNANFIISRNTKDFSKSVIPVMEPAEFLKTFAT